MKVKIGKYRSFFGPYQLAEVLCFWAKKEKDEYGFKRNSDFVHRLGNFLSHGSFEDYERKNDTSLYKFLVWIDSKKKRKIHVKIDKWDTWNVDYTLSLIIVPLLEKYIENLSGGPLVDDEDVPENIRSTNAKPKENEYDFDEFWYDRWKYVLEEILWAHRQIINDDGESQFYDHSQVDDNSDLNEQISKLKVDRIGLEEYNKRIGNGLRLFGKYYRAIWL